MPDRDLPAYAELHCLSNFTFLRGASHPGELVQRAAALGYEALALTDECSLAGVVRARVAARDAGLPLIIGSEVHLADGTGLVLLATDRAAYGRLAALITRGRRAAPKGEYRLGRDDLAGGLPGCLALWLPPRELDAGPGGNDAAAWVAETFGGRARIAVELLREAGDRNRLAALRELGRRTGLALVAAGDVHMHVRARRPLQDTLTAIRLRTTVAAAGLRLLPNGERCLRTRRALARLYPPELLAESVALARQCRFSLDELRYEYPAELVPPGVTPAAHLGALTAAGLARRFPGGVPARVRALVEHELALIAELAYEPYFLTVHDIVCFARGRGILCQGRGSAANSAVCYALGITEVDPSRMEMLFERFVSRERNEPPDIDVDFEHERREEVLQYVYEKYGRERAALAATVITYRGRSAVRDAGKALGLNTDQVDRLAKSLQWWDGGEVMSAHLREAGLDPDNPLVARTVDVARALAGFPRHLSQHVGGFVISRGPLSQLVPVENAAMPGRTVIQWDKDDLDALGLLKVDCLALGMLSAIRRCLDLAGAWRGRPMTMADVPAEDPAVYAMIQRADTVGVFQVESRAQMAMLPRLKPACFYDLVIEVAIVRPGPIQGDMVHPYLRRRQGLEPVDYPSEEVRDVLERTLGVPIFQEQVIKLAMVAAGFTPGEADHLRRSMAAWKRNGSLSNFEQRLLEGMRARGYDEDFARRIYQQIRGFGEYGFPESHSASFALLVYVSAWLKHYEPAAFTAALLNSQPMGFYAPAQLVGDARRHGVEVLPVDVTASEWDCTLERTCTGTRNTGRGDPCEQPASRFTIHDSRPADPALRLGLRMVRGLNRDAATRLVAARAAAPFRGVADMARRAALSRRDLETLAGADALARLAGHRHRGAWSATGVETPLAIERAAGAGAPGCEPAVLLRRPAEGEDIVADYAATGLTLRRHPLELLRPRLARDGILSAADVYACAHGTAVRTAGLVICRQCPSSASGVIFATLEDETGNVQVIVWPSLAERQRRALLGARLLGVSGEVQRDGDVLHVIAGRLHDHSRLLGGLLARSRDFR